MPSFDAIVIGSGQAGNPLAFKLADHGWTVALIEKEHLGGTCINTGCTPTKTMIASAQVAHYARGAAKWGVRAENVSVDLAKVVARKDAVVRQCRHCGEWFEAGPGTRLRADAEFCCGEHKVRHFSLQRSRRKQH